MNMESSASLSEDQVFTMRQCVRHVCVALKRYFECHLILKVNELKRSHLRSEGGSPQHETPAYKVGVGFCSCIVEIYTNNLLLSCHWPLNIWDLLVIRGDKCGYHKRGPCVVGSWPMSHIRYVLFSHVHHCKHKMLLLKFFIIGIMDHYLYI